MLSWKHEMEWIGYNFDGLVGWLVVWLVLGCLIG
jgi:hypothetical protein